MFGWIKDPNKLNKENQPEEKEVPEKQQFLIEFVRNEEEKIEVEYFFSSN